MATPRQLHINANKGKDEFVHVISVRNLEKRIEAGHIFEVTGEQAAGLDYDGTHRVCTKDELEKYQADSKIAHDRIMNIEADKRQPLNVTVVNQPAPVAPAKGK